MALFRALSTRGVTLPVVALLYGTLLCSACASSSVSLASPGVAAESQPYSPALAPPEVPRLTVAPQPADPAPSEAEAALSLTEPEPAATVPPEPAPTPWFAGRNTVTYTELVEALRHVADDLAESPEVQKGYQALLAEYNLSPSDVSLQSYSRTRLVFEATRDGGLWGLRWAITDRMPWSDVIWKQWREHDWETERPEITAIAECDELSAMFSFLTRDVGVDGFAGLFYPEWNHTVAVWQVRRGATEKDPGEPVRIVVPTSQIWLSREATLGTREFKTNRVIFPYKRLDLKPESELPAPLARYLMEQLQRYGAFSNEALLKRRERLGGS